MNFAITWLFDKLGYMPKIDLEIGKVKFNDQYTEFKMWPFPVPKEEKPKPRVRKTKPLPSKATVAKAAAKKSIAAKKATKGVKKVK